MVIILICHQTGDPIHKAFLTNFYSLRSVNGLLSQSHEMLLLRCFVE